MDDCFSGAVPPRRNFYGRRHGKALRPAQRRNLAELLPRLAVPGVAPAENPGRLPIDLHRLFAGNPPVWLEIGFGAGDHLAAEAARHPQVGLIGCEPFINGVAMALGRIAALDLANVRIHAGDARDLIDLLPDGALARVFLLYPDPWPKPRHHRRRFMSPDNLAALARVMATGAELRLATDVPGYVTHALAAVASVPALALADAAARGRPWPDWQPTRYELKALRAGRAPQYLSFVRR